MDEAKPKQQQPQPQPQQQQGLAAASTPASPAGMPPLPMFDALHLRMRSDSGSTGGGSCGSSTSSGLSPAYSGFGDIDAEGSEGSLSQLGSPSRLPVFSTLSK